MSSTTQVYRDFIARGIDGKPVTALPGIGVAYGGRLSRLGYYMVSSGLSCGILEDNVIHLDGF